MKDAMAQLPQAETIGLDDLAARYLKGEWDLLVVMGPTASGKTRYAVSIAEEVNAAVALGLFESCPFRMTDESKVSGAEIISADSRQVYRGMDIGTGKDLKEYGEVKYHLIDILPAGQQYNVFQYVSDFKKVYADIRSRRAIPILCGGTGMYINAVTRGYDFSGEKIPLSQKRESRPMEGLPQKPYFIGTLVDRDERNRKIDRRLDERLEEGMVQEVRSLLESGVKEEVLISYGLEYKYVTLYLTGQIRYDEMREKLAIAIHQFAKRQMTWLRGMERSGVQIHWTRV